VGGAAAAAAVILVASVTGTSTEIDRKESTEVNRVVPANGADCDWYLDLTMYWMIDCG